jgi:hypothetical protein
VAARLNAVAGASAIALVFLAQLFVAATATVKKVMKQFQSCYINTVSGMSCHA